MREIGSAAMPIIPTFDGIKADLERGISRPMDQAGASGGRRFGNAAGRSLSSSFGRHARRAALLASGAIAGVGYASFKLGKDSVAQAADLGESINAVNVAYGDAAKGVLDLGRNTEDALSNLEFNNLAVRFSAFAETISGGKGRKTVKTLDDLTTRAGDFASVFNIDVAEAASLFQSGLAGESEPLRRYGINLSAAAVQAHAYAEGIANAGDKLTDAQKVQATYALLMDQTAKTQGDYANTSDSAANAQRRLGANFDDVKAKLGNGLLPIVEDATNFLVDEGVPAFERFSDWFAEKGAPAIRDFIEDMKPLADEVVPAVGSGLSTVRDALETALPYAKDFVGAFNDMPEWAKQGLALGAVGAGAKAKFSKNGLFGGRGGTVATPAYVYVVNNGTGTGGGKKGGGFLGVGTSVLGGLLALEGGRQVLENAPKLYDGLQDADPASERTAAAVKKALESSDIGRYAEQFGLDVDALAEGIAREGARSQEFQAAVEKLQNTNDGAWEHINDLIPVVGSWITTSGDQAAFALRDLRGIVEELNVGLSDLIGGKGAGGTGGSVDLTATFAKIPEQKLKVLQDPETVRTRGDVRDLLENVDGLTRGDFRLIFQALGLEKAKDDAATLLSHMKELTGLGLPGGSGGGRRRGTAGSAAGGAGINIGTVAVQGTTSQRLFQDMADLQRRLAIGGYS